MGVRVPPPAQVEKSDFIRSFFILKKSGREVHTDRQNGASVSPSARTEQNEKQRESTDLVFLFYINWTRSLVPAQNKI